MDGSVKEILCGETELFEVSNVQEAVELAHELKAKGHYDWFRGQVRDLPPYSSLFRVNNGVDAARKVTAQRRVHLFTEWVARTPELHYLMKPEHVHDFCAIIQHYGIPTHYIDFSTDPTIAGFFAADTKNPPSEGRSCIYCLNTDHLKEAWDYLKDLDERKGASIEAVTVDVRNLWRLQAQHGVFVYAPYNWDVDYPLDRITFPYTGYPPYPTRESVYPEHKSPLEELLDQYFSLENATFANEEMVRMFEQMRSQGGNVSFSRWETWESGYYPKAFPNGSRMVALDSWGREAIQAWGSDPPHEDYHKTAAPTVRLKLKATVDPEELRKTVAFGVKQILRSDPGVRSKALDWAFTDLTLPLSSELLNSLFRPAWNGMRRLPYSDAEIADALGSIAVVLATGFDRMKQGAEKHFSQCFGDSIEVGFTHHDGSSSRAWVARETLRNALRPDMVELLTPKYRKRADDVRELFKVIYNPTLMFEFDAFKGAFAREIIPAQVLLGRSPILFNPARLSAFGLP